MTLDLDETAVRSLADRLLNKTPVRDWAIRCLEEGFDSPSLRVLAAMLPSESPFDFDIKVKRALEELGWSNRLRSAVILQYAQLIANDVLERKADPIEASRELYSILRSEDLDELAAWWEIDEMIWSRAYYSKTEHNADYYYREHEELVGIIMEACEEFVAGCEKEPQLLKDMSFEDAERSMRRFLRDTDHASNIEWVFFDDVICTGKELLIRTPLPPDNRDRAKLCFELGKERNFGVALNAFCSIDGETFCYVVLPENDRDAELRMFSDRYLKMSVKTKMLPARRVGKFLWSIRRRLTQWNLADWERELPNRVTLLPRQWTR